MKKGIVLIIIALNIICCFAQEPWVVSNPQNRKLNCVVFSSFNYGCAVGALGTVLNTEDNGNTWNIRNSGTTDDLNSVCFTDGQTGYAVGINGTILKTATAGNGWAPLTSGVTQMLTSVKYNAGYVIAGGINSSLLKSTNGLDWTNQWSEANCHVSCVTFADATTGFAACADGKLLKTTNSGANWYLANTASITEHLTSVCFPSPLIGYVVGHNGLILQTQDAWTNSFMWQTSGVTEALNCVHFVNELCGYAVGNNGTILKTTNAGEDWINISYGTAHYTSVYFITEDVGFIVGYDGVMLKTTTGGVSVEEWENKKMRVYPNPASDILYFDLKGKIPEIIQVHDLSGKVVFSKVKPDNSKIHLSDFTTGLYHITFVLQGETFSSCFFKK